MPLTPSPLTGATDRITDEDRAKICGSCGGCGYVLVERDLAEFHDDPFEEFAEECERCNSTGSINP